MERESEDTLIHAFTGPPPGTVLLHKYRVDWTLGMGGYGLVLRAQHLTLDTPVAIKILREDKDTDTDNIERFLREAQAAVRIKSPHATPIWEAGRLESGAPYMVMELLDGLDLGQLLEARERLSITEAVDFIIQACDALAEAHSLGIVHRDIKPSNLFVTRRPDGSDLLKVLDFGISKSLATSEDLSLTQTASLLGTPMYMSPEQMRSARSVDIRSDIWSVGCVLHELVEGGLPFPADNFAELCVMVATEPPQPMSHGAALEPIVRRCLAKDPGDRYATLAEMVRALEPFASPDIARTYVQRIERVAAAFAPAPPAHAIGSALDNDVTLRRRRRARPLLAISLVAAIAGIGLAAVALGLRADPTPSPPPAPAIAHQPAPDTVAEPPVASPPPPVVPPPPPVIVAPPPPVVVAKPPPVVAKPPRATVAKPRKPCNPYGSKDSC